MKPTLSDLAAAMYAALPPGETANYVADLAMWHTSEIRDHAPIKPENAPYYGQAFADALAALKLGHTHRIVYHLDRLAAAVKRGGGILQEQKRIERNHSTPPQPSDRKTFEGGRVPWTGK